MPIPYINPTSRTAKIQTTGSLWSVMNFPRSLPNPSIEAVTSIGVGGIGIAGAPGGRVCPGASGPYATVFACATGVADLSVYFSSSPLN